jgi:hypothetical protein
MRSVTEERHKLLLNSLIWVCAVCMFFVSPLLWIAVGRQQCPGMGPEEADGWRKSRERHTIVYGTLLVIFIVLSVLRFLISRKNGTFYR